MTNNINYYYPKSLMMGNKYLFFDIFIKNNELILIVPIYDDFILDEKKLLLINIPNKKQLILKEAIKYIEYEGIIILKYDISDISDNKFMVKYGKISKEFNLEVILNIVNIYNEDISISTLFKDDYNLLETWINYYCSKNISDFYLYYNGKIENIKNNLEKIINNINNNININIIEWDYPYWNHPYKNHPYKTIKYKHHAQTGMLNHCFYFYAKNHYYWLNIDLDEYINNINILNNNYNYNYDLYLYNNRWAKLENDKDYNKCINFEETKFYLGTKQDLFKNNININDDKIYYQTNRCKWIINTCKFNAVGIHLPKIQNINIDTINNDNLWFAHFSNWTNSNIRKHYFKDTYILDYHYSSSSSNNST
jgi:hypothetical protein